MFKWFQILYCRIVSKLNKNISIYAVDKDFTIEFKNGSIIRSLPNVKSEDIIRGRRAKIFNPELNFYYQNKKQIDKILEQYIKKMK